MPTMLCRKCISDVTMQKMDIFNDVEYYKLLMICISYRCPYGVNTFMLESHMATTIMELNDVNSSMFLSTDGDLHGNEYIDE